MRHLTCVLTLVVSVLVSSSAAHQQAPPNILVIFGDDIGQANISA